MRPNSDQKVRFKHKLHEGRRKIGSWDKLAKHLDVPLVTLTKWKSDKGSVPAHASVLKDIEKKIDAIPEGGNE